VSIGGESFHPSNGGRLRRRVGFLTESPGLWDQLTAADNLLVYARLFGVADPAAAVERSLRHFDLWERRADRSALLSKGMKQKLALARALVHDPEVVLLDEPTANLDPHTARAVRELLLELRGRRRAVVVSTHNLDEIERMADRVALINTRLVAIGDTASLRRQIFGRRLHVRLAGIAPADPFAPVAAAAGARDVRVTPDGLSVAIDDPDIIPSIVRALVTAGAAIRAVVDEQPSLEDVYLRLLGTPPAAQRERDA
jgi:ABC-2 type transport system ATP-binding protein